MKMRRTLHTLLTATQSAVRRNPLALLVGPEGGLDSRGDAAPHDMRLHGLSAGTARVAHRDRGAGRAGRAAICMRGSGRDLR